ncbi:MAG TPA: PHP domain-containing protein [Vicinamibacterales bacterium]
MIDLHTHTTESDGRCAPGELVARAAAAGVTVLAVTDHDTLGGCEAAAAACAAAGMTFVTGIEISAMRDDHDVHVLGYFIDVTAPGLHAFLSEQRRRRIDRVRQMVARLAALGIELDAEAILRPALEDPRKAAGRPWIARALVAGGHVANTDEAFDRWLERGKPAFVPRPGASPAEVISRIHDAKGLASLAHPALVGHDEWIGGLASEGLDALEAYHSEHDTAATARYLALASTLGIAVSGGSDFHGDPSHGPSRPGAVSLPGDAYDQLRRRATIRAAASGASASS